MVAWKTGKQQVLQPVWAESDRRFGRNETLLSASVATLLILFDWHISVLICICCISSSPIILQKTARRGAVSLLEAGTRVIPQIRLAAVLLPVS
mmetsp:Transcript_40844/g.71807  ORF Transcript_40844/g.71807 Transcript_40844/m.71807 type:complete len:94 (+) Transcript_40844:2654-2935(+)